MIRTLILVVGKKRSGRIWMINVIRALTSGRENIHIIKISEYDEVLAERADLIFSSTRNSEEIEQSLRKAGMRDKYADIEREYLKWVKHACYTMHYATWASNPDHAIGQIAKHLGVDYDLEVVKAELEKL